MLQEALGGLKKPAKEGAYCLVDLVVELIRDRSIEETVEQPAVGAPNSPVAHQGEGPRESHAEIDRCLSVGYGRV